MKLPECHVILNPKKAHQGDQIKFYTILCLPMETSMDSKQPIVKIVSIVGILLRLTSFI